MRERRREIGFALAMLLSVPIGAVCAELAAQVIESRQESGQMNWSGLRAAAAVDRPGPMIFRPGSSFDRLRFNNEGLRGPDIAVPTPPDTIRIMFTGDSKMFAAEVDENQAVPARTIALLRARHPQCRFDYANMSGPGYTLPQITQLMRERLSRLDPSIIVLLGGSTLDLIGASASGSGQPVPADKPVHDRTHNRLGQLLEDSDAFELLQRELLLLSPGTSPGPAARQTLAELVQRQRLMLGDLAAAIEGRPALAIAYRGRSEANESFAAYWLAARRLRQRFPGMDSDKAAAVRRLVIDEMQRQARSSGWQYIDPIASIADSESAFLDRIHFSPAGHAHVAREVANAISRTIDANCTIPRPSPSGKM
jgi:lysophospholipase L1-like esterase